MLAWHVPFLGWRQLPAELSEFEIAHFFTLKPDGIRAVRSRYKIGLRLGAALQLGFLRMCGRPLSAMQRVPRDLLQYLGKQLPIPAPDIATLRAIYQRPRDSVRTSELVSHLTNHETGCRRPVMRRSAEKPEVLHAAAALQSHHL